MAALSQTQDSDEDTMETAEGEPGGDLTEIERSRGAQLVRVEVRAAGRLMKIACTIMPDPDDSRRALMVQRDPATRELVPLERRGRKRYVERKPDGSWRAATG